MHRTHLRLSGAAVEGRYRQLRNSKEDRIQGDMRRMLNERMNVRFTILEAEDTENIPDLVAKYIGPLTFLLSCITYAV
jgi:hypothetical protein